MLSDNPKGWEVGGRFKKERAPCPASKVLPTHAAFDGEVIWSDRQNESTAVILILISGYTASKTSFPSNFLHVLL